MTSVAASVWNQIAKTQELETEAAKVAFRLNQEQLGQMVIFWMFETEKHLTLPKVVLCLPTFLPLLTESLAIGSFTSQHPNFRNALPEVLSADEAVQLAIADYRLTPQEQLSLRRALESPQSLKDWEMSARAAALT